MIRLATAAAIALTLIAASPAHAAKRSKPDVTDAVRYAICIKYPFFCRKP